jgi:hypothetical protein
VFKDNDNPVTLSGMSAPDPKIVGTCRIAICGSFENPLKRG